MPTWNVVRAALCCRYPAFSESVSSAIPFHFAINCLAAFFPLHCDYNFNPLLVFVIGEF